MWTDSELDDILSKASIRSDIFRRHYSCTTDGNCKYSPYSDPHGEFGGKNVLFVRSNIEETAQSFEKPVGDCREELVK